MREPVKNQNSFMAGYLILFLESSHLAYYFLYQAIAIHMSMYGWSMTKLGFGKL